MAKRPIKSRNEEIRNPTRGELKRIKAKGAPIRKTTADRLNKIDPLMKFLMTGTFNRAVKLTEELEKKRGKRAKSHRTAN